VGVGFCSFRNENLQKAKLEARDFAFLLLRRRRLPSRPAELGVLFAIAAACFAGRAAEQDLVALAVWVAAGSR
jgi:hypothetical protein